MTVRRLKKTILFACCLFLALTFTNSLASEGGADRKLVILFTHDMHSHFFPHRVAMEDGKERSQGGYAKLAYLIREQRDFHGDSLLLVDAGDFSMGTLFHTAFLDEAFELRLMGDMGYDVVTFGNHDFDFHSDGLARMLRTAKAKGGRLPLLVASNVVFGEGHEGDGSLKKAFRDYSVREYVMLERNGLRIGVFGVMGKDAADDTPFAAPLTFADPVRSSQRVVDILKNKEKADVVICLSHAGTSSVKMRSEDERLARDVPDIDVIISGHTHTVLTQPVVVGKTLIVSSGSYAAYLGALTLEHSKQKGATPASYRLKHISADIPDDKRIAAKISTFKDWVHEHYLKPHGYRMDQVIAESDFHMESFHDVDADPAETGLGNLITDAFRHAVERAEGKNHETIHLAIQPLGMIRGSFLRGNIAVSDVFQVLSLGLGADGVPGYPLVAVYIYGDEMKSLLEVETSIAPFKRDAHLQISGVTFTFNPHRIPFDRVTAVAVRQADGTYQPLESGRLYRVCMNFYTAVMVDFIRKSSQGLLRIEPKDREGRAVTDMKQMIVDADSTVSGIQELKEWDALAAYLKTFPDTDGNGIPNIPDRYRGREGRFY